MLAVNLTGDSDSTGAIAGNLLGALHGVDAIPAALAGAAGTARGVIEAVADDLLSWPQWPVGEFLPTIPAERRPPPTGSTVTPDN